MKGRRCSGILEHLICIWKLLIGFLFQKGNFFMIIFIIMHKGTNSNFPTQSVNISLSSVIIYVYLTDPQLKIMLRDFQSTLASRVSFLNFLIVSLSILKYILFFIIVALF